VPIDGSTHPTQAAEYATWVPSRLVALSDYGCNACPIAALTWTRDSLPWRARASTAAVSVDWASWSSAGRAGRLT